MSIPIIFIHHGNADCLFYAVWHAKQTNPNSRIILLGDKANAHFIWLLGIEHYYTKNYTQSAQLSLKNYIHLSTNGEEFERFCIARWFILHEFLTQNSDIGRCVYLDSDILVYDSLDEPAQNLSKFGMTMVFYSAHTNFINQPNLLGEFCSFIRRHYDEEDLRQWLRCHHENFIAEAGCGGISDMTFFHKFTLSNPDKIATLFKPMLINSKLCTFDERIDSDAGGYQLKSDGLKLINWQQYIPYGKHKLSGKIIKFFTLHFQGNNKQIMVSFVSIINYIFYIKKAINNIILLKTKTYNKLQRFFKRI
ncbi:hypothetical protein [Moorena sp. SIO4A5]|uniref:hypothetical protein n=1 Tax=Moorena sp. SIO4A5 TaxID=2607838 RepID=UPI0013C73F82|nr:hypothetical protein [Moorena sp. SIO4A5]NEO22737.1 hypothetical protein [Moorena sp. SIO4A5]